MKYCGQCGQLLQIEKDGASGAKKNCPNCLWKWYDSPTPVILALVTAQDDQIVYVRQKSFAPGMWSLVAGFIEKNETCEDAAKREVKEETGLDVEHVKFLGSYVSQHKPSELVLAYHYKIVGGKLQAGDDADEVEIASPNLERFRKGSIAYDIVKKFTNS